MSDQKTNNRFRNCIEGIDMLLDGSQSICFNIEIILAQIVPKETTEWVIDLTFI